jgi:peptidoglycan/LPS O-acetylase OafA/YrhL
VVEGVDTPQANTSNLARSLRNFVSLYPTYRCPAAMEIRKLNTLRGLAALIVLVSHYSNESGLFGKALGLGAGQFGVMIFFLLSAFLISFLYLDRQSGPGAVFNFAIARIARVIPLYFLIVILSYLAINHLPGSIGRYAFGIPGTEDLLAHLLFFQGTNLLWTIPPEIHFYVLFAVLWLFWSRLKLAICGLIVILITGSLFLMNGQIKMVNIFGLTADLIILRVFPFFAVGFLLGALFRRWQPEVRFQKHFYVLSLLVVPFLFPVIFFKLTGRIHAMWEDPGILAVMSAIFFLVVFLVPEKNPVLENWLGDLFGRISYSLYLLHFPLLKWLRHLGLVGGFGGLVLFLLLASGVAYASFVFLERPLRNWIRSASVPI